MAGVLMRFIHNVEALRRERGGEFFGDPGLNLHGTDLCEGCAGVNPKQRTPALPSWKSHLSRLEGVIANSA
jgi:hypothetical protein